MNTTDYYISDSTITIVPFEISPLISNDETLLNGLKYNSKKGAGNFCWWNPESGNFLWNP